MWLCVGPFAVGVSISGQLQNMRHGTSPPRRASSRRSRSRSPVGRRRPRRDDFESPHGHGRREHSVDLPPTFKADSKYLDKNMSYGRQLYRHICSTPWSNQVGLANRPVEEVKVHELCYLGWENHHLRTLSAGAFVSLVFARSVREAQVADAFLRLCRTEHADIENMAFNRWSQIHGEIPVDKDARNKAMQEMAKEAFESLRKYQAPSPGSADKLELEELRKKVKDLEAEKAVKESGNSKRSSGSTSPPPSRRRRVQKGPGCTAQAQLPVDNVDDSPLVNVAPSSKPLKEQYPATSTAQGVNAWIRKLPAKLQGPIKVAISEAEGAYKRLSDAQKASLGDVAAGWGLGVKLAAGAKDRELARMIAVAYVLSR